MRVYLAGTVSHIGNVKDILIKEQPYLLESYFYINEKFAEVLPYTKGFMLDSGAFTFMQKNKDGVNWEQYIQGYASFINKYNIEYFFELDIDSIVGYEKVLEYRRLLEKLTNKKCIPVWHVNRGKDEFIKMCQQYDYVALGGIVGGSKKAYARYSLVVPWFIKTAHRNGCRIHGLGVTGFKILPSAHFDSVDSTGWISGNRFGYVCKFNGTKIEQLPVPPNKRLANSKEVVRHNLKEWIKFQKYAEVHL